MENTEKNYGIELLWVKNEYFLDSNMGNDEMDTQWVILTRDKLTEEQISRMEEKAENNQMIVINAVSREAVIGITVPFVTDMKAELEAQKKTITEMMEAIGF